MILFIEENIETILTITLDIAPEIDDTKAKKSRHYMQFLGINKLDVTFDQ